MQQDRKSKLLGLKTMTSPVSAMVGASRVGADLRAARERLGWTLPDIAAHLRIRLPFLEAIEEGRTGDLPGNAYAVGFVRTYGQSLGLDPDEIARRFRAEAAEVNHKTELSFPAPVPERGIPAMAVVLLGGLLVVGAYVGWYRMSSTGSPAGEAVRSVPERLVPLAQLAPPSPATSVLAPTPQAAGTPPMPGSPVSASAVVPVPLTPPISVAAPPAGPVLAPDAVRIVVRARSESWVQIRDKSGSIVLNRILRAGENWNVPARSQLTLTTGNAGGTDVVLDGMTLPALGAVGVVRRDLPLDVEQIRAGKLAGIKPL